MDNSFEKIPQEVSARGTVTYSNKPLIANLKIGDIGELRDIDGLMKVFFDNMEIAELSWEVSRELRICRTRGIDFVPIITEMGEDPKDLKFSISLRPRRLH